MKRWLSALCAFAVVFGAPDLPGLPSAGPARAQGNDDDYTPLNSRIRRNRQFPTSIISPYRGEVGSATRERSKKMMGQFTRCLYNRSNEDALDLLARTDYGFVDFAQINLENDRAARTYGFQDCLRRVAESNNSGVTLRWTAFGLRRWLIEQAYFDRYPDGPSWLREGYVIDERAFPLSSASQPVAVAMELADCMVAADPVTADYLFRIEAGSEREAELIDKLVPSIQPCLPAGQRIEITPEILRAWIGEGLWHASQHTSPPPAEASQEAAE
jgi:hypothetical protein